MEFFEHLKSYLSEQEIDDLKKSLEHPSMHGALLNLRKMSDETFIHLFPNAVPHPIVKHAYLYNKEEYNLGKTIYHELGCFYLQEPSAMIPSFLLNPQKGEIVLDLCAAPGGKSVQASFLMENQGIIISNDLSRQRASSIVENAERLGIGNLLITNNDFSLISHRYRNYFDKIILDAPCSGSGMFRKDQDVRDDWSYNKVLRFQEIQKSLILMAYDMLKPGGTMVYSTCSFSKEEDEDVISYLLNNSNSELLSLPSSPLFYISKEEKGIHLLPSIFPGEGHFVALIKKPGQILESRHNLAKDKRFLNQINNINGYQSIEKYGDYLFALPFSIETKGLNVLRYGVKIGEIIKKDEIRYDYHYGGFVESFGSYININEEDANKYIEGNPLPIDTDRGYLLLKYNEITVDITKSDGSSIKNHYPKGLRKHF